MKKFLAILLLPLTSFILPSNKREFTGPHNFVNVWQYGPGEYVNSAINTVTHALYQIIDVPTHFTNLGDIWKQTQAGAHHAMAVTIDGRVGGWGDNGDGELGIGSTVSQNNPVLATVDSLGNVMDHVIYVTCGGTSGWNSFCLKDNGTVHGVGDLSAGTRGNGTFGGHTSKWVQIPFPAGVFIVAISCSFNCIALDNTGQLWTWGGKGYFGGFGEAYLAAQGTANPNCFAPTKVHLPAGVTAKMIAGGGGWIGYALGSDNNLYGWGLDLRYAGIANTSIDLSQNGFNPMNLTSFLNLEAPIDSVVENSMYTTALLTNGKIFGWGSNACGNGGVGMGIDYNTYVNPWAWDQGRGEAMISSPRQIFAGKSNFTQVFGNTALCFFFNATDQGDSVYGWGREKGGVLGDLIETVDITDDDLRAAYPNSCDANWGKAIFPFRKNSTINITCPYFISHPTANLGSKYPIQGGSTTHVSAGSNQSITNTFTTLFGTPSWTAPATGIYQRHWTVVSTPTGAPTVLLPLVENDTVPVSNLITGSYVFRYRATNSWFVSDSTTVTITVSLGGNIIPSVNAGVDQSIQLPTNTINLAGTATGNNGATIVSVSWSQISGPNASTIVSNSSLNTVVNGLIQGTYTFRLSAVDNNNSTNTDDITVVVNPANITPQPGRRNYFNRTRRTSYW